MEQVKSDKVETIGAGNLFEVIGESGSRPSAALGILSTQFSANIPKMPRLPIFLWERRSRPKGDLPLQEGYLLLSNITVFDAEKFQSTIGLMVSISIIAVSLPVQS